MPPITTFPAPPEPGNVYHADCFTLLDALEPESVNAIITDMPYGVTCAEWDTVVDLPRWWQSVKRVLKPRGVMVTTAKQPFTSALVMSNLEWFKYEWIWEKSNITGLMNAKYIPLGQHENILVFSESRARANQYVEEKMNYFPQGVRQTRKIERNKLNHWSIINNTRGNRKGEYHIATETNFPRTILKFPSERGKHPTQKPVPLYEYLTITYTLPGDLIVDPFCGSGTTLLAARNLNRRFIGGDITERYIEIAKARLAAPYTLPMFEQPAK